VDEKLLDELIEKLAMKQKEEAESNNTGDRCSVMLTVRINIYHIILNGHIFLFPECMHEKKKNINLCLLDSHNILLCGFDS